MKDETLKYKDDHKPTTKTVGKLKRFKQSNYCRFEQNVTTNLKLKLIIISASVVVNIELLKRMVEPRKTGRDFGKPTISNIFWTRLCLITKISFAFHTLSIDWKFVFDVTSIFELKHDQMSPLNAHQPKIVKQ